MSDPKTDTYLSDWKLREENAEAMVPTIGRLFREHGVIVKIFGIDRVNKDPVEILKAHRFARQILESEISVLDSLPILQALGGLHLAPCHAWYDNEFGYSRQVVRILEEIAGLAIPTAPE
jgi:glyceraldehyde 3-phosphate dehydrogenase